MSTTTPNMQLVLPDVEETPGPDWATMLNNAFDRVDNHDHSEDNGVRITPGGLNINQDLAFGDNNITQVLTLRMSNPEEFTPGINDRACIFVEDNELFYVDGDGNSVQLTSNGNIDVSGIGSITGMAGTTASVVYSDVLKNFTFLQDASESSTLVCGGVKIFENAAVGNAVTVQVSSTITNYEITLPEAPPPIGYETTGNNSYATLKMSNAGEISVDGYGQVPLGAIISIAILTGSYFTSATTVADAWGFVLCNGQTLADVRSALNGQIMPNLNPDPNVLYVIRVL